MSAELTDGIEDLLEVRDPSNIGSVGVVLGEDCVSVGGLELLAKVAGAIPDMLGE